MVQLFPQLVRTILGLLIVPALTRHLGTRSFGQYALVFAYVAVFSGIFGDWGLGTICLREISQRQADRAQLIGSAASLQLLIALGTYVLLMASLLITHYPAEVVAALAVYGISMLLSPLDILALPFQADLRVGRLVGPSIAGSALSFVLVVAAIQLNGSLAALVGAALVGLLAQYSWVTFLCLRNLSGVRFSRTGWGYYLAAAWPIGLSTIVGTLMQQAPLLALSFVSLEGAGLFNAAVRLPQQLILLPLMVRVSTFPLLSEAWVSDPARFRRLLSTLISASLFVSVPVALFAIGMADPLVQVLFGSAFSGAALPFRVLMASFAILFPAILAGEGMIAAGLQRWNFLINAAALPVLIVLLGALVPRWGAAGAAEALLVAYVCLAVGAFLVVWMRLSVAGSIGSIFAGVLAAATGAAVLGFSGWLGNLPAALLAASFTAAVLGVLQRSTVREVWRLIPHQYRSSKPL